MKHSPFPRNSGSGAVSPQEIEQASPTRQRKLPTLQGLHQIFWFRCCWTAGNCDCAIYCRGLATSFACRLTNRGVTGPATATKVLSVPEEQEEWQSCIATERRRLAALQCFKSRWRQVIEREGDIRVVKLIKKSIQEV